MLVQAAGVSYYAQRYVDSNLASQWYESESERDGASKKYFNTEARLSWSRPMGDWCDSKGELHGNSPFSVLSIEDTKTEKWFLDVTEIVNGWVLNEYPNQGFMLRGMSGNGTFHFHSRETREQNKTARLTINNLYNEEKQLKVDADTYLDSSTSKSLGSKATLSVSKNRSALLRFKSENMGDDLISKAILTLYTKKIFGKNLDIGVFRICSAKSNFKPKIRQGIARGYQRDKGIDKDKAVLFVDNFDAFWWLGHGWTSGYDSESLKVVKTDERTGFWPLQGKALRVTVPRGGNTGMNMSFAFREEGLPEPENLFFRYYLRFSSDWQTKEAGKLPGLSGTYNKAGWGGRKPNGYDGWSARGLYRNVISGSNPLAGRIPVGNYLYHAELDGNYGEHQVWSENHMGYLQRNRWYSLEQQVKLNTPGKSDGVLRAWVDGILAYENTAINYRKTADLKIEKVWMNVYHGGMTKVEKDIHLYIDNVVVARNYIGPIK